MSYPIVNSVGLLSDIAGAVLIFKFGLPEEVQRSGTGAILLEGTNYAEIAKAKRYDRWARIGLGCLIGGFSLQLIANLLQLHWAGWLSR